jgi:hypothetical protein
MANQTRQTSLGMQSVGSQPFRSNEFPRGEMRPGNGRAHMWGIGVTLFLHIGIAGAVIFMNEIDRSHVEKTKEEPYQAIEAGLAIKAKSQAGKKTALPQKDVVAKVKPPEAPGITKNADAQPKEDKPKEKKPDFVPPEATDAKSVFDKYRRVDTGETQGADKQDKTQIGDPNGSEFGTLERAKGDPYVGELIGRMTTDFVVPTVVADQSLVTFGCVKLDESGKIVDRAIDPDHKSRSHAFNSSVEDRLKDTTDMDKPVPSHLKKMLVGKFVCATYTSRTE